MPCDWKSQHFFLTRGYRSCHAPTLRLLRPESYGKDMLLTSLFDDVKAKFLKLLNSKDVRLFTIQVNELLL